MKRRMHVLTLSALMACGLPARADETAQEPVRVQVEDVALEGDMGEGGGRLVIEAVVRGAAEREEPAIWATALRHVARVGRKVVTHAIAGTFDIIQGRPKEIILRVCGDGAIDDVTGDLLRDWSIRREGDGTRLLVLRLKDEAKAPARVAVEIGAETALRELPGRIALLALAPPQPALFSGFVKIEGEPELEVKAQEATGLVAVETKWLPEAMQAAAPGYGGDAASFRFQGEPYSVALAVAVADPEARQVVLRDFRLIGRLAEERASFELSAIAQVQAPDGGVLSLLSGGAALTELDEESEWRLARVPDGFLARFDRAGDYPIRLAFDAAVRRSGEWNAVDFRVAPSALQPVALRGFPEDTQFEFVGAARPSRTGDEFSSYLPPDGTVKLSWKAARPELEGRLFYSAEMLAEVGIGPGLMRQVALLEAKVMQGELSQVVLELEGAGEVTRVQGDQVLAWTLEPGPDPERRHLSVQFNQPQRERFALQLQLQTPLGVFPQAVDVPKLRPVGATRFAGYYRIINQGAVRLEVTRASGLAQVSPEQFPESDATRQAFAGGAGQRFAFRFSGPEFELGVQADNILPEVSVSQLLVYHLGETETAVHAELEVEIRDAPLRELTLSVPRGYVLAQIEAAEMTDYFLTEPEGAPDAELRLVYGRPVEGRQVIRLQLERNQALEGASWETPAVSVAKAKSVRGHVAAAADAGFRLTWERAEGLTELATAFFPRAVQGIQLAFRVTETDWRLGLRVERLPQTVQADALHLFSIGEGIAYGSSTLDYLISGAPVGSFAVDLSGEYFNVEFVGKDVRGWRKVEGGYEVQLHGPVSGAYTLLATYERPFQAQGDTLLFTGARPLGTQSEQGHTIVISAFQFEVKPVNVSPGLLRLEPGEVPAEHRLFFDAPILAAYRYSSRPFNLELELSPLAQSETLGQVADRAVLSTRISKEGQVLTDVRYFVKNRGQPHLRVGLAAGTELWSAAVNGGAVVPVTDEGVNLIPLPQHADPNAIDVVELKLASRSPRPKRVTVAAPVLSAPVLLARWSLEPDTGQRLIYRRGTLKPVTGPVDVSGFHGLASMLRGRSAKRVLGNLVLVLILSLVAAGSWRGAAGGTGRARVPRLVLGTLLGFAAFALALAALDSLGEIVHAHRLVPARALAVLAPVQQAGSEMRLEVGNVAEKPSVAEVFWRLWPGLLCLGAWGYSLWGGIRSLRPAAALGGWVCLAWAALRWPNGTGAFLDVLGLFLIVQIAVPALCRLWRAARRPPQGPEPATDSGGAAPAAVAVALLAMLGASWLAPAAAAAQGARSEPGGEPRLPLAVIQEIRVEGEFALATARIRWAAEAGARLDILGAPGVLTRLAIPETQVRAALLPGAAGPVHSVLARDAGVYDIEVEYQLHVLKEEPARRLLLPTPHGLVNRVALVVQGADVDVLCPSAVSIERTLEAGATRAALVLAPEGGVSIEWRPRSRDASLEKAVMYAELSQLYVPTPGVIEGVHQVAVRPAQGEVSELLFQVPARATITDVFDPEPGAEGAPSRVGPWRFDPDARRLRVTLSPAQSRPFALVVRSQVATGPLPFTQTIGLLSVEGAAGQLGVLGIGTGAEVQLTAAAAEGLTPINLEDFPGEPLRWLGGQVAELTVRRTFRYSDPQGVVELGAAPVEPDVRVETAETLSLGEDRTVLAADLKVTVTRAGIFQFSFLLPPSMELESLTGAAMSHWTELDAAEGRVVTVHLNGKTLGEHAFAVQLAGPGVKGVVADWEVPRLAVREASKQRGQLLMVPEQGLRLEPTVREGITQFDPQAAEVGPKGVLAFRLLQGSWKLVVSIEQVPPWIQVTGLQHVIVSETQMKATANLLYQIENTGLKTLRVVLPAGAESVRFQGDQVADFLERGAALEDGGQVWEVKLHRPVMGTYPLQATYQERIAEKSSAATVFGVRAEGVNLQRGFLTIRSAGRLQVRVPAPPPALQPSEWQSIPRDLLKELPATAADFTFRLADARCQLSLELERHEPAKLLPARLERVDLTSVISDDGVMLTHVELDLVPGDKRLLGVALPPEARFWFAFVNRSGVWPWTLPGQGAPGAPSGGGGILIPLEQPAAAGARIRVEFFFSSQVGRSGGRSLDLKLHGPKLDLPLENITWRIYLDEKWQLRKWTGTLQLEKEERVVRAPDVEVTGYLAREETLQREKTAEAEQLLAMGNALLERGDPQQARQALKAAFGLSTHDDAFNEDARVQLHKLKVDQALQGLNARRAAVAGEAGGIGGAGSGVALRDSPEESATLERLAERLIQQQDAAVVRAAAIRASIPEQGRLLAFRRAVEVGIWADLRLELKASAAAARPVPRWAPPAILLATLACFALVALAARGRSGVAG